MSQKPAVRDNRGTPLTLTLSPEAGERGFFRLPLPLGEGWGEGAFPRIDAQSCYDFGRVPSLETFSESLHYVLKHGPCGCRVGYLTLWLRILLLQGSRHPTQAEGQV